MVNLQKTIIFCQNLYGENTPILKNMNGIVQLYLFMTTYMLMFISQCAQTHYGMQYKHYQISMQMEQENFQAIKK